MVTTRSLEATRRQLRITGVAEAFAPFGALAVEPLAGAHDRTSNWEARDNYAVALSLLGVRDQRIARVLEEALERDPPAGALLMAQYGGPSLLSAIEHAIASYDPDFRDFTDSCDLSDVLEAYADLGGVLTGELASRVRRWEGIWARNFATQTEEGHTVLRGIGKPRSRERCSCNSGKRYHKCCMPRPRPSS